MKGDREHYQPVKSVLCDSPDPLAVAMAFRHRLGLNEVYIADLDAIRDSGATCHREVIAALARRDGMSIILDAGVSDVENVRTCLELGVRKVVIGAETLQTWKALRSIPDQIDRDRLVFSVDMRAGTILSRCPVLAAMPPMEALRHLQFAGWREVILLDLDRVGSGTGVNRGLVAEARTNFPDLALLVGGGIANPKELTDLISLGVAGVLVSTSLHRGTIGKQHLSLLSSQQQKHQGAE